MVGQFLKSKNPKSKQEIHYRLTPKCFLAHVKRQILPEQSESSGNPITWEKLNMPMYRKRPYFRQLAKLRHLALGSYNWPPEGRTEF